MNKLKLMPKDSERRKDIPVYSGFMLYFPNAILAVARLSKLGNDQHHPDEPLHWDMNKSTDEMDALMRHSMDPARDHEQRAWRAMANL